MFDPVVRRYLRAAEQRFTAAEMLLRAQFYLETMYLAGYVVECATKSLIPARTPARQRARTVTEAFRGRRGHDYEELKGILRATGCVIPLNLARNFRTVSSWSTDLRYAVSRETESDATAFRAAAKGILEWVRRSL